MCLLCSKRWLSTDESTVDEIHCYHSNTMSTVQQCSNHLPFASDYFKKRSLILLPKTIKYQFQVVINSYLLRSSMLMKKLNHLLKPDDWFHFHRTKKSLKERRKQNNGNNVAKTVFFKEVMSRGLHIAVLEKFFVEVISLCVNPYSKNSPVAIYRRHYINFIRGAPTNHNIFGDFCRLWVIKTWKSSPCPS